MRSIGTGTKHQQHGEHGPCGSCCTVYHVSSVGSPTRELFHVSFAYRGKAEVHVQRRVLLAGSVWLSGGTVRVPRVEEETGAARDGGSG